MPYTHTTDDTRTRPTTAPRGRGTPDRGTPADTLLDDYRVAASDTSTPVVERVEG